MRALYLLWWSKSSGLETHILLLVRLGRATKNLFFSVSRDSSWNWITFGPVVRTWTLSSGPSELLMKDKQAVREVAR